MASFVSESSPQQISVSVNGKFGNVSLRDLRQEEHSMAPIPLGTKHTNLQDKQPEVSEIKKASRESTIKGGKGAKRIIDRSADLPKNIQVKTVLASSLDIKEASELSTGCNVTKFGSKGAPRQRRVYVNFRWVDFMFMMFKPVGGAGYFLDLLSELKSLMTNKPYFLFSTCSDGTLRLNHSVPLFQSFMSENKGVFFLYSCYKPHCLSDTRKILPESVAKRMESFRKRGEMNGEVRINESDGKI